MHERAGTPATESDLIDVEALVRAYYDLKPDVSVPEQRVVFGTSGHRGSSFNRSFNEQHILAITQAIVEYRTAQGVTGPLFIGADTHALSAPAQAAYSTSAELAAITRSYQRALSLGMRRCVA